METNEEVAPDKFAGSPFLSAKNYKLGDRIDVKVLEYKGFQKFVSATGDERSSPIYVVSTKPQENWNLRLNKTSVSYLVSKGLKKWEDLIGKTITLLVTQTNKGNSLSVIDLK